jgi:hypothetical protein
MDAEPRQAWTRSRGRHGRGAAAGMDAAPRRRRLRAGPCGEYSARGASGETSKASAGAYKSAPRRGVIEIGG